LRIPAKIRTDATSATISAAIVKPPTMTPKESESVSAPKKSALPTRRYQNTLATGTMSRFKSARATSDASLLRVLICPPLRSERGRSREFLRSFDVEVTIDRRHYEFIVTRSLKLGPRPD